MDNLEKMEQLIRRNKWCDRFGYIVIGLNVAGAGYHIYNGNYGYMALHLSGAALIGYLIARTRKTFLELETLYYVRTTTRKVLPNTPYPNFQAYCQLWDKYQRTDSLEDLMKVKELLEFLEQEQQLKGGNKCKQS